MGKGVRRSKKGGWGGGRKVGEVSGEEIGARRKRMKGNLGGGWRLRDGEEEKGERGQENGKGVGRIVNMNDDVLRAAVDSFSS